MTSTIPARSNRPTPGQGGQSQADRGRDDHHGAALIRGHRAGRDGLARLVTRVGRGVEDVVQRADRGLQGRHGDPQADGGGRFRAGDKGHAEHDDAVEERREWVGQADEARQSGTDARRRTTVGGRQT